MIPTTPSTSRFNSRPTPFLRRRRGFTLLELTIGGSLTLLISASVMFLFLHVAREQRRGLIHARLATRANALQENLLRLVRSMSVNESVLFTDATTLSNGAIVYRRVLMSRGESDPTEELIYNPATHTLTHDLNRAVSGDERPLFTSSEQIVLRDCYFYPSMKTGGAPDNTTVNITLILDDNGSAGERNPDGSPKLMSIARRFSVKMRNI
ncbi:MAG: hypothetical protein Kow0059_19080 [Candidatus Sumerlaeia bacterium]